jgi:Gpi18-like mannosyltransferase
MEKKAKYLIIFALLLAGFAVRIFFADKSLTGDLLVNAEWGQKLVQFGARDHYFRNDWYHTAPVYPPFSQLVFGGAFYLFDHKYVLAQIHNIINFPPAAFIVYFYKSGYYLLLKLPGILADLGLSLIIYKVLLKLTKDNKKALIGAAFYIFNPVTIFLSGFWGQTDSFVALLGIGSFLLLNSGNVFASLPLLFLSLYFKPSWAVFVPFYLYLIYLRKPNIKSVFGGIILSLLLFLIITVPFAHGNVFTFTWKLFTEKIPLPFRFIGKASNSAFNFYTIFFRIDIDSPPRFLGLIFFFILNIYSFFMARREKNKLLGLFAGLFSIGIGNFLFMTSMLERYFFPGFVPMIILMFARPKLFWGLTLMNLIFFANIVWSFYRRTSDEIGRFFVANNFLVIRILSAVGVTIYPLTLKVLQFKRE